MSRIPTAKSRGSLKGCITEMQGSIALLFALPVLTGSGPPLVLFKGFDGGIMEFRPTSPQMARAGARPQPNLTQHVWQILNFYSKARSNRPVRLDSIFFALNSGSYWLYVDKFGRSELNGKFGHFDVPAFAAYAADHALEGLKCRTPLLDCVIVNHTSWVLEVSSISGAPLGYVVARDKIHFTHWHCPIDLCANREVIANSDAFVKSFTNVAGARRVRITCRATEAVERASGRGPVRRGPLHGRREIDVWEAPG